MSRVVTGMTDVACMAGMVGVVGVVNGIVNSRYLGTERLLLIRFRFLVMLAGITIKSVLCNFRKTSSCSGLALPVPLGPETEEYGGDDEDEGNTGDDADDNYIGPGHFQAFFVKIPAFGGIVVENKSITSAGAAKFGSTRTRFEKLEEVCPASCSIDKRHQT
jgi:hypothetical protein